MASTDRRSSSDRPLNFFVSRSISARRMVSKRSRRARLAHDPLMTPHQATSMPRRSRVDSPRIDHIAYCVFAIIRSRGKNSALLDPLEPDADAPDEQRQANQAEDKANGQHDHRHAEAEAKDHEDEPDDDGQDVLQRADQIAPGDD